jgi:hypothetical protein
MMTKSREWIAGLSYLHSCESAQTLIKLVAPLLSD